MTSTCIIAKKFTSNKISSYTLHDSNVAGFKSTIGKVSFIGDLHKPYTYCALHVYGAPSVYSKVEGYGYDTMTHAFLVAVQQLKAQTIDKNSNKKEFLLMFCDGFLKAYTESDNWRDILRDFMGIYSAQAHFE